MGRFIMMIRSDRVNLFWANLLLAYCFSRNHLPVDRRLWIRHVIRPCLYPWLLSTSLYPLVSGKSRASAVNSLSLDQTVWKEGARSCPPRRMHKDANWLFQILLSHDFQVGSFSAPLEYAFFGSEKSRGDGKVARLWPGQCLFTWYHIPHGGRSSHQVVRIVFGR